MLSTLLQAALCALAATAPIVQAQGTGPTAPWGRSFTDESNGITYVLGIPAVASAPFPLLMTITAPRRANWAGFATGGCMLRSPLIVAWANGTSVTVTTRWAPQFHAPRPYTNTTISVFESASHVNDTHWVAGFVCSRGCSDWYGGAIDPTYSNATFGYAASSRPVADPKNVTSPIGFHDLVFNHFDFDLTKARLENFDDIVHSLGLGGVIPMHPPT